MFNFDYVTKNDIKWHNPNWPETPDHPYRILIFRFKILKKNALLNLKNNKPDTDNIFLYGKYIMQSKISIVN